METQSTVVLSVKKIKSINTIRKRPFQPETWKDNQAKMRRNSGEPYIPRSGEPKSGVNGPTQEKACGDDCTLIGCRLGLPVRLQIFRAYWEMKNYNTQRTYLASLLQYQTINGRNVYGYYLSQNGSRYEVCRKTFMDTFSMKLGTLEYLKQRINHGEHNITDKRGLAPHPNSTDPNIKIMMEQHLDRFPKHEIHYSRRKYGEFYLSPDLNISRMFKLFVQENPNIPGIDLKENLYRSVFRKSGLKIGLPRSDTCKTCDKLNVSLIAANDPFEREIAEHALHIHHLSSDNAYVSMNEDLTRAREDLSFVVICGDLQQVLFCPTLTHSDVFYKRQLSTYNYCLYNGNTENGTMCVWDESVGHRGVDEVASCLLTNIIESYEPLGPGERRTLVFWSDRCRGQVNNWQMVCIFLYLISRRYFTEVEQKFLLTGHTFLPCDRLFALIEKRRQTAQVMIPDEWIAVIQETRIENPFSIQRMTQNNIMNVKTLERLIPRPQNLLITSVAWLRISFENPHSLLVRQDHNIGVWNMFRIVAPNQRGRLANRLNWTFAFLEDHNLIPQYNGRIPISAAKRADLMSFLEFMSPRYRPFYINLPFENE